MLWNLPQISVQIKLKIMTKNDMLDAPMFIFVYVSPILLVLFWEWMHSQIAATVFFDVKKPILRK